MTAIIRNAATTDARDFFREASEAFGLPVRTPERKAEDAERAIAWRECQDAMAKAPKGRGHYWRRRAYEDAVNARFAAQCAEIHAKYHPVAMVEEVHGDPLLKSRRAA
jgi:hypothetical protein